MSIALARLSDTAWVAGDPGGMVGGFSGFELEWAGVETSQ